MLVIFLVFSGLLPASSPTTSSSARRTNARVPTAVLFHNSSLLHCVSGAPACSVNKNVWPSGYFLPVVSCTDSIARPCFFQFGWAVGYYAIVEEYVDAVYFCSRLQKACSSSMPNRVNRTGFNTTGQVFRSGFSTYGYRVRSSQCRVVFTVLNGLFPGFGSIWRRLPVFEFSQSGLNRCQGHRSAGPGRRIFSHWFSLKLRMSIASLLTKWMILSTACAGQFILVHRQTASPSGL